MNYKDGIDNLVTLQDRKLLDDIYSIFHNYIRGKMVNKYQLKYLKDIYINGDKIDKKLYIFWGNLWTNSQYYAYLNYRECKHIVDDYYPILPKYPALCELEEMCEICDRIEGYIEHESFYDRNYAKYVDSIRCSYQYENDKYVIVIQEHVSDILEESAKQRNCLHSYVWQIAFGYTTIVFMRAKEEDMSKSLITIEIRKGVLRQAFRAFNRTPNKDERGFIIEFAREKNLVFDIGYDDDD